VTWIVTSRVIADWTISDVRSQNLVCTARDVK
jgi:hypothetical protein